MDGRRLEIFANRLEISSELNVGQRYYYRKSEIYNWICTQFYGKLIVLNICSANE